MEFHSVLEFLHGKSIFVTGATGFLAKVMVEKILRVQPNVKKLYLLIRAADDKAAAQRLKSEVIEKELFRVLKEKWRANFGSMISEKVVAVAGDISDERLLVLEESAKLRQELYSQINVIVNLAATTNFDERYDVALDINTMGAKHVLNFAKKCVELKAFIHVSTAYVCGEREEEELILESPYNMGDTLNGKLGLQIEEERKLVNHTVTKLRAEGATQKSITLMLKDLGIERAKYYGWPNTYVFTKAMGEMLISDLKEDLPVIIIRPTIVSSTYKEPFPGWVEGVRTIDSLAVAYGKGKLTCFLGDVKTIIDVIPVDMVVNAMLVAMTAHASQPSYNIYHVSSSMRNPLLYGKIQSYGFHYFTAKPWINKDGQAVRVGKVTILNDMPSFHRYMTLRYLIFLKGLEVVNTALCHYFDGIYMELDRKIKYVMRLVELYRPYLFFKGVFDDINTEKLQMAARDNKIEIDLFYFDPKSINWDNYFMNIHLPGVVRHVFK
ncbi:alcohol-forming fatty acyl-CoA reductase-like isoform X1 [Momordica charantia]|uniref:Fatty acyl-CoA reductase n=1 Tax=Momordica charantia TaxID=3673 RepID=A0A6J1DJ29_MOMCH|nr:alcohol-forming fatty acyl-CoA reductase-like isoform X1 [Momordica charantia]